jgi:maltose O-acetyltransferase
MREISATDDEWKRTNFASYDYPAASVSIVLVVLVTWVLLVPRYGLLGAARAFLTSILTWCTAFALVLAPALRSQRAHAVTMGGRRTAMSLSLSLYNTAAVMLPSRGAYSLRCHWLRWSGLRVGTNVRINAGTRFYDKYVTIGDSVWIGPECSLISGAKGQISIGSGVDIAPGCIIVSGSHLIGDCRRRAGAGSGAPIEIGDGCWVGARATVLAGAKIGSGCVVAAGAVVKEGYYPDDCLIAGVPATVKRQLQKQNGAPIGDDSLC